MSVAIIALLLFIVVWVLLSRGTYRRRWQGENRRLFEREWEVKLDKQTLYFAVPSFKSAYFDLRPASPFSKLQTKFLTILKIDKPTPLETHFHTLFEDPQLAQLLSDRLPVLDALVTLREIGQFRLISTGNELHGYIKMKDKVGDEFLDSPELQKTCEGLGQLIESQFDLPLNEMKPREIQGWRRSAALPIAMVAAGLFLLILRPFFVTSDLMLEPRAFKVWLGLSIFATGLGLLWSSMRVPPHYFARTALAYGLLFSWSAFFGMHGVFTSVNQMFAANQFVIECQISPDNQWCLELESKVNFKLPTGVEADGRGKLKFEARMGWLGQIFFVTANPAPLAAPSAMTTEAPAE